MAYVGVTPVIPSPPEANVAPVSKGLLEAYYAYLTCTSSEIFPLIIDADCITF